jgi:hypothetical protein
MLRSGDPAKTGSAIPDRTSVKRRSSVRAQSGRVATGNVLSDELRRFLDPIFFSGIRLFKEMMKF